MAQMHHRLQLKGPKGAKTPLLISLFKTTQIYFQSTHCMMGTLDGWLCGKEQTGTVDCLQNKRVNIAF